MPAELYAPSARPVFGSFKTPLTLVSGSVSVPVPVTGTLAFVIPVTVVSPLPGAGLQLDTAPAAVAMSLILPAPPAVFSVTVKVALPPGGMVGNPELHVTVECVRPAAVGRSGLDGFGVALRTWDVGLPSIVLMSSATFDSLSGHDHGLSTLIVGVKLWPLSTVSTSGVFVTGIGQLTPPAGTSAAASR